MDQKEWLLIKKLFSEAVNLPSDDRDAWLREACPNSQILAEVKKMIANDEAAFQFMETPLIESFVDDWSSTAPVVGDEIGPYHLDRLLGEGGMGQVFLAFHKNLKKQFAIKFIKPLWSNNPQFLRRFQIEAESLGRLQHPNIITVTDFGFDQTRNHLPFLVMEYLEGPTLQQAIRKINGFPLSEALPIFRAIAQGLDHAHEQGVLHRDLKPGNVILSNDGNKKKIFDFGIASLEPKGKTLSGPKPEKHPIGTPEYMSPEIFQTGPSRASDIYAFGVLMYETLVGQCPQEKMDPLTFRAVEPCLSQEVVDRPATAEKALKHLERVFHNDKVDHWKRTEKPKRCKVALVLAVLASLLFYSPKTDQVLVSMEQPLIDLRFASKRPTLPDNKLILLTIDNDFLDKNEMNLADMADLLGSQLKDVLDAGASGVAIDLILPRSWSQSPKFANFVISHHKKLALAAVSNNNQTVGSEAVEGAITQFLGTKETSNLFAFTNLRKDSDGKVRKAYAFFEDSTGEKRAAFPTKAASLLGLPTNGPRMFWINFSVEWKRMDRISWSLLPEILKSNPQRFQGKLVLVGAEFTASGDNHHAIPSPNGAPSAVSGLVLHALAVNTLIQGPPIENLRDFIRLAASFIFGWITAFTGLYISRPMTTIGITFVILLGQVSLGFLVFNKWGLMVPMTNLVMMSITALLAGLLARKYFTPHPRRPR